GSRRRRCCHQLRQPRCCFGRCSLPARSTCERLTVGGRLPKHPSVSQLTSQPDSVLSKCRRSRHPIPTQIATAPVDPLHLFSERDPAGRRVFECALNGRVLCLRRAMLAVWTMPFPAVLKRKPRACRGFLLYSLRIAGTEPAGGPLHWSVGHD